MLVTTVYLVGEKYLTTYLKANAAAVETKAGWMVCSWKRTRGKNRLLHRCSAAGRPEAIGTAVSLAVFFGSKTRA